LASVPCVFTSAHSDPQNCTGVLAHPASIRLRIKHIRQGDLVIPTTKSQTKIYMLRWKFQYSMQPAISCPCEFQAAAYSTSPYKYLLRHYWNVDWLLKSAILMPRLPSRPSHLRLALPSRIPQSAPAVLVSNFCRALYVRLTYSSSMHNSIRVLHFERQLTQGC